MKPYSPKSDTAAYIERHLRDANVLALKLTALYGSDFYSFLYRSNLDNFIRNEILPLLAKSPDNDGTFLDNNHWPQRHPFNFPGPPARSCFHAPDHPVCQQFPHPARPLFQLLQVTMVVHRSLTEHHAIESLQPLLPLDPAFILQLMPYDLDVHFFVLPENFQPLRSWVGCVCFQQYGDFVIGHCVCP